MLYRSNEALKRLIDQKRFTAYQMLSAEPASKRFGRWLLISLTVFFGAMLLPWTQNVRADGYLTSLRPENRPQPIPSIIAGRIEKWFVREGDYVSKGDTIVFISEIKDAYFDPNLLSRTEQQIKSKEMSVQSYMEKVKSLDSQIDALLQNQDLKIQQTRNKLKQAKLKVKSDSIDLVAAKTNLQIAQRQFDRAQSLYDEGLKSLTDLENKRVKLQETQAKLISAENKYLTSQNEVLNARMELNTVANEYQDKLSKAESEKFASLANMYDSEALVTKLQNQYMNYSVRQGMYFIKAPQNGYVTKINQTGIGETIKEGQEVITIMPEEYSLAVEIYVNPVDLPLIDKGQEIQIQFDGWPAIVFSGWPNLSYGTYQGTVVAIDRFISDNGKFRIMVAPAEDRPEWPNALRVGGGAQALAMLKDVPLGYEIWRQINGFPPDFYKPKSQMNNPKDASFKDEFKK